MRIGTRTTATLRGAAALAALAGVLLLGGGQAQAAVGERISSFVVGLQVEADGRLRVTETIVYDFGVNQRRGIERYVPVRFPYDGRNDRVYPIEDVVVKQDGRTARVEPRDENGNRVFRIGDPDEEISGQHTYELSYVVRGALNSFDDHEELFWNAVGNGWRVPIDQVRVDLAGPAAITRVDCFAGAYQSRLSCENKQLVSGAADFDESALAPAEGLTVVAAFPAGSVRGTGPILEERFSVASAFRATPWTLAGAGGLALLGGLGAAFVGWRVGRDRRFQGQIPGLVPMAGEPSGEKRVPLTGAPPVAVEFTPPDSVRPGQVGTLIDEVAHTVDVTATIIDFAVRGHLHIREIPKEGLWGSQDWELARLTDGDPEFLPFERTLFDALFERGDTVLLSELKNTFATDLARVQGQLYADLVAQGWYRSSPAATRRAAYAVAVLGLVGAVGVTFLLAKYTHAALVGVGLLVAAVVGLAVAGNAPARTGRGSAALARIRGFELYLTTAEAEQIAFEEREQIFSRYLPYAMVFGIADRWAGVFSDLGAGRSSSGTGLYWYTGQPGWTMAYFGASIGSFTTTTSGTIASTPPSASGSSGFGGGGFSGGGGGGGGGGSW